MAITKIGSYEVKNCSKYFDNPMWNEDFKATDMKPLGVSYDENKDILVLMGNQDKNGINMKELGEINASKREKMFLSNGIFDYKLEDKGTSAGMDNRLVLHVFPKTPSREAPQEDGTQTTTSGDGTQDTQKPKKK